MARGRGNKTYILLWLGTAALTAAVTVWYVLDRPLPAVFGPSEPQLWQEGSRALDLNTATAAELEALPGIGPALAKRILDARAQDGPFAGPEALQAVPGIGPALWEGIAPYVCFGDEGEAE